MVQEHVEALYPPETREQEIGKLLTYVKEGVSSQLISVPGVGKEDLCELLIYNRALRMHHLGRDEESYHFVLVSFTTIRHLSLIDVTKTLFLVLTESLHERKRQEEYEAVNALLSEGLSHQDEAWLFSKLKQAVSYLAHERGLKLVFLLDRFKLFFPEVSGQFFTNLESLRVIAKYRVSFVFTLNRPLEESLDPTLLPTISGLMLGRALYLSIYDAPSFDFQLAYLQKIVGRNVEKDMQEEIKRVSGGHAKMAKTCIEEVLAHDLTREQLWGGHLLQSKAVRSASYDIWNVLTTQEQTILKKFILLSRHPRENEDKDSRVRENDTERRFFLEKIGLIHGSYFTIPLFEEFVRYRAEHLLDEKIVFDPESKEIRKGDTILSAKLTKLEYKLLCYLIEHPQTIVTKDDIIDSLWVEAKSTAGVSEQAIDQLIFRLRRKIEENPTSPSHLLTIKGRGISFTS